LTNVEHSLQFEKNYNYVENKLEIRAKFRILLN